VIVQLWTIPFIEKSRAICGNARLMDDPMNGTNEAARHVINKMRLLFAAVLFLCIMMRFTYFQVQMYGFLSKKYPPIDLPLGDICKDSCKAHCEL